MNPANEDAIDWEAMTWEGSRRRQIEHWAGLSLDEIFEAQEEMADLARELATDRPPLTPALYAEHRGTRSR